MLTEGGALSWPALLLAVASGTPLVCYGHNLLVLSFDRRKKGDART